MIMLNRTNKWFCEEADEVLNLDMELLQQKAQPLAFNLTLRRDYLRGAKGIHSQQASDRAQKRLETHES